MGELLDFKDQGNFDFFKFSSYYGDNKEFQRSLKSKCEHVLEYAHATVQDMCLLGYNLKELKESGKWQWVFNPETGYCFDGGSFGEFCAYAFGFSKTRTSDLLRISKFVQISGTKHGFLPEKYTGYNTSQLVELAAVEDGRLHYFNPDMTVDEMRLVKRYMEWGTYWDEQRQARETGEEFDILTRAKVWKEEKDNPKSTPSAPITSPDVIPGQIDLEELDGDLMEETVEELSEESIENPTSDFAEDCQEENDGEEQDLCDSECDDFDTWLEKQPEGTFVQGGGIDSDFIEDQMPLFDEPQENPTSDLAEDCQAVKYDCYDVQKGIAPWYKVNLKNRIGVREFYSTFRDWEQLACPFNFMQVYRYRFKKVTLYAVSSMATNILQEKENREYNSTVRYFWQGENDPYPFETGKFDIENYIQAHRDEFEGGAE